MHTLYFPNDAPVSTWQEINYVVKGETQWNEKTLETTFPDQFGVSMRVQVAVCTHRGVVSRGEMGAITPILFIQRNPEPLLQRIYMSKNESDSSRQILKE